MLRVVQNSRPDDCKKYFSTADYYTEGQELVGVWGGKGAELLSLNGLVQKSDFDSLCDNFHPKTQEQLTAKTVLNRTVGYDFNFHCPKSVSLAYTIGGDERILDAFRQSVRETMTELETEAETRVRKGGADTERKVGNLTWAEFIHTTSRPVDGVPDPHLHAHCFVFNAVYDSVESQWKAGFFKNLKRDAPYYEAAFHARFANRLKELGYDIERNAKGWEIAGLSKSTLDKFSRRTAEIEELAAQEGITDPDKKSELGAKTRKGKAKQYSIRQLKEIWNGSLTDKEKQQLGDLIHESLPAPAIDAVEQAWQHSLDHSFERASVVPEKTLLRHALKRGVGEVAVEQMWEHAKASDIIVREREGRRMATTREVFAEEKSLLDFAKHGRGTCKPLNPHWKIERDWLNIDQKRALNQLLNSNSRVMILAGRAGTGKTTMLQEFQSALQEQGIEIHAFAPSADASRGVQRKQGFTNAETVARLLVDPKLQQSVKNGLVWIDEAGLLGTKTLRQVFSIAKEQNARVLLSGDKTQHGSVERGSALKLLEEQAGIKPAKLEEIQRQKGDYREAVKKISQGDLQAGFELLQQENFIQEIPDQLLREERLAKDYVATIKAGKTSLVISPTHAEGNRVTTAIRYEFEKEGLLKGEGHTVTRLESTGWTDAERADPANFQKGDVIQFEQNAPGHKKGERIIVGELVPEKLLQYASRFQVYRVKELDLKAGDLIRITSNGKTLDGHRVYNGHVYRLAGFTKDENLKLENGWIIDRKWGHIQHGYCITSHASQGHTVQEVFVAQSMQSWPATSKEQFYVSVSRGTDGVRIYTDSKEELLDHINLSADRLLATELVKDKSTEVNRRRWWQTLWQWREILLSKLESQPQRQLREREMQHGR